MYRITLSEQARKEYLYFVQSGNKAILNKIRTLLEDIAAEHRIVYSVHDDIIEVYIFSMRYHYSKK